MRILDNLESMVKHVKQLQQPTIQKPEVNGNESPNNTQQSSVKR